MTLRELFTPKGELNKMLLSVRRGAAVSAFGMRRYERMIASATLGRFVYICADLNIALEAVDEFRALGLTAVFMPQKDDTLSCAGRRSTENDFRRLGAAVAFATGAADVLVATSSATAEIYPRRQDVLEAVLHIERGKEYDIADLASRLTAMGYTRCEQVTDKGSYAVRGDILDVWSVGDERSIRIEFFGDEAESVRRFDPGMQTARDMYDEVFVYPATDIFTDYDEAKKILDGLPEKGVSDRLRSSAALTSAFVLGGDRSVRFITT